MINNDFIAEILRLLISNKVMKGNSKRKIK